MKTKTKKNKRNRNKKKTKRNSNKEKTKLRQKSTRYWLSMGAMGALVAYNAIGGKLVLPAQAQPLRSTLSGIYSMVQAQSPTYRFDIQPGNMESVLSAFQNLTGLRTVTDNPDIRTISSPGVSGGF